VPVPCALRGGRAAPGDPRAGIAGPQASAGPIATRLAPAARKRTDAGVTEACAAERRQDRHTEVGPYVMAERAKPRAD
jgi:hypothetical protein